ncbi:hypothetical protein OGAPHI_000811 [Ogataea philodendri]|uniref:Uncharacterized protein n=1 Tax=Ogataea philodendri TaxID=1378263 RepID=A0A9P8PGC2_9ASCO|nr:uncharacterized protein OGAPHI_000811 [Ogataea philodendri]KAH3671100.1 hypothetical protein OGAPHI_000811 [Ogataea philodendri]
MQQDDSKHPPLYAQEIDLVQKDNYTTLYRLVDDLAAVLNENCRLKNDIWHQSDQLSCAINADYQGSKLEQDPSLFKYPTLGSSEPASTSQSSKKDRITQLDLENKKLAHLLKDRQTYNEHLRNTIDESEQDLLRILTVLADHYVQTNKTQLENQISYSDQFLDKKQQMHAKYLQLIEINEKSKQLYVVFDKIRSFLDNGVSTQKTAINNVS